MSLQNIQRLEEFKLFLLASNQYEIWFDQAFYSDSPLYNVGGYLSIEGKIDSSLLNRAILQLINESEALRINFSTSEGRQEASNDIYQVIANDLPFSLEFKDFSNESEAQSIARQWIDDSFKVPFDLYNAPCLWHFALLKVAPQCYFFMTKYHHLIADGWTTKIVIARLAELYNALLEKRKPADGPRYCFTDYLSEEYSYQHSQAYQRDELYWRKLLPELPKPLIGKNHNHHQDGQLLPKANIHRFLMQRGFYNQLQQFSSSHKVSTYHLLMSAIILYFSRVYSREDIVIGVPSLNRNGARFKDVPGMFISLSPLCLQINFSCTVDTLIKQCGKKLRENYRHQRYPLAEINNRLELIRHKRSSLFDIVISYERQEYSMPFGGSSITAHQQFSGVARYPLCMTICEFNELNDVEVVLEGSEASFSSLELQCLEQRLVYILKQIINYPQALLKDIELLSEPDKHIVSKQLNNIKKFMPFPGSVVNLFQQRVALRPQSIALETNNKTLTYQQLDEQSNQLAHYLIECGAKQEEIIAISLPRSKEMIIGLLAILKTGAAYLPIDPNIPDDRIASILEQSQALALISLKTFKNRFSMLHPRLFFLDKPSCNIEAYSKARTGVIAKDKDLAYVLFTSGSSGKPKGVLLEHGALVRRLLGLVKLFSVQEGDRIGQTLQFNFDPSIIEIFMPLIQGGCIVIAPEYHQTPEAFSKFVVEKKINMLAMVPSGLRALVQGLAADTCLTNEQITELKTVCCGGEVLPVELAKQFIRQTNARLFNVYGPTETVILASAWECSEADNEPLPIGCPIDDSQLEIVDKHNKALPPGIMGEIAIGGIVARGYLKDESQTLAQFFSKNDLCYYKTGDTGYLDFNGLLYFSGRLDRQVKISGYRIEPDEIEAVIKRHPDVIQAAVISKKEQKNTVLYAFVEFENESKSETLVSDQELAEVSALLRISLPDYMQPGVLVPIQKIPVLPSGKIDYSALKPANIEQPVQKHKLPRSQLETHLMQCWEEVLDTHELDIDDNFFEFGADSLSAIQLIKKIEMIAGHHCPLSFLLENPTIEKQAQVLGKEQPDIAVPLLTTLSEHTNALPFYLAASGHGDAIRFANLAEALGEVCSLHMLQPTGSTVENKTIEELAKSYSELILIRDEQPGYIGGFSIGGIVALETARILSEQGKPPLGTLLLDTVYPHGLLRSSILFRLLRFVAKFPLVNQIKINGRRMETMLADPGICTQLRALRSFKMKPYQGEVILFISRDLWGKSWCFYKWNQVSGLPLGRYEISGMHGGIFQPPHLPILANAIRECFNA